MGTSALSSKYGKSLRKFWHFRKVVADKRWSLMRGGCEGKFDCSIIFSGFFKHQQVKKHQTSQGTPSLKKINLI